MIEKRAGKIVNVSSQTSEVALHNHAAYMASKAGLNALTKTMTVEWAQYNIQSNAVCPTVIMTPMGESILPSEKARERTRQRVPIGHFGTPEDIAEMQADLARMQANYDLLLAGTRPEEIQEAEANVQKLQGQIDEVDVKRKERVVVAPERALV
ncbi:MAG: SDR family oxidoreductase, partial [Leptolyngbyaceae cyanobacterium SU_3_3]|nr:SDR family oxidoreductase [Leptolyngbyaceae cyanobacterium SU_3_3]